MSTMNFGDSVRNILSASYGADLRRASPTTPLPEPAGDPACRRVLAANLELAFGITIPPPDLEHWETVRDVMQCVRLRLWEKRTAAHEHTPETEAAAGAEVTTDATGNAATPVAAAADARPVFVTPARDPRERFRRYVPPGLPWAAGSRPPTGTRRI